MDSGEKWTPSFGDNKMLRGKANVEPRLEEKFMKNI